jgi:hypothetical protein
MRCDMLKIYTCAGCSEPIDESRAFVESDGKGSLRHLHTHDECFTKWHNKQKELDEAKLGGLHVVLAGRTLRFGVWP